MSEEELIGKAIKTIKDAAKRKDIVLDDNPKNNNKRNLNNGHRTMYVIFEGNDTSRNPYEKINIIGETWNCGSSGTSIICIGFAQITDNANNNSKVNLTHWAKIIRDKVGTFIDVFGSLDFQGDDGLIFNVKCH
jgi:RAB protein geranylgeranyltransferase component A